MLITSLVHAKFANPICNDNVKVKLNLNTLSELFHKKS